MILQNYTITGSDDDFISNKELREDAKQFKYIYKKKFNLYFFDTKKMTKKYEKKTPKIPKISFFYLFLYLLDFRRLCCCCRRLLTFCLVIPSQILFHIFFSILFIR